MIIVNRLVILAALSPFFPIFQFVCPEKLLGAILYAFRPILFHTPFKGAHFHATFTVTANEFSFVWNKLLVAATVAPPMNKQCDGAFHVCSHSTLLTKFYCVLDIQVIPCIKLKITKHYTNSNHKEIQRQQWQSSRSWNANIEMYFDDDESKVDRLLIRCLCTDE